MKEKIYISNCINSVYYFLQCVLIVKKNDCYCLFVRHNGNVLVNKDYETLKGAKIAFHKLFNKKAWKTDIKAKWSHFYDPESQWLEEKTKVTKSPRLAYKLPSPSSAPRSR